MQTVKTLEEYQAIINQVRETKIPIKVKSLLSDEEIEKGNEELDMEGIEVIMTEEYDLIKPL